MPKAVGLGTSYSQRKKGRETEGAERAEGWEEVCRGAGEPSQGRWKVPWLLDQGLRVRAPEAWGSQG